MSLFFLTLDMVLEQNEKCPVQIADLVVLADYLVISQDEEQAFDIHFLYGNGEDSPGIAGP
jgi:hypothetical protein